VLDDRKLCIEIEQLILVDVLKAAGVFDSLEDFLDAVRSQVHFHLYLLYVY